MKEVSLTGEVHGDAGRFRRGNNFFVTNGPARLHNGDDTRGKQHLEPVSEGEEGITGGDRASSPFAGAGHGKMAGVNTVDLAHSDADGGAVVGEQDAVGLDRPHSAPREFEVGARGEVCFFAGNQLSGLRIEVGEGVYGLNQNSPGNLPKFLGFTSEICGKLQ